MTHPHGWLALSLAFAALMLFSSPIHAQALENGAPFPLPVPEAASQLELVATFPDRQVTGVAVSETGRVFVSFPYWSDQYEGAVAELLPDGSLRPYPNPQWNAWREGSGLDPRSHFVCVQSVFADGRGQLWVLDPAAPRMQGPVPQGPKLVRIDLETDRVRQVIHFSPDAAPAGSYLNDVRIDSGRDYAYLTDSGRGALVVVDLVRATAYRVLEGHPSTQAERITPVIGGRPLRTERGQVPRIHADGLALSPDGAELYYHALTGYHLYRVPTQALRLLREQPELLAAAVENLGPNVVCDGMAMDGARNLYLTALERNAVVRRSPNGELSVVVQDVRLRWPDSLALGPAGDLYVTTSQIHLSPQFNEGRSRVNEPWALYRIPLDPGRPTVPLEGPPLTAR